MIQPTYKTSLNYVSFKLYNSAFIVNSYHRPRTVPYYWVGSDLIENVLHKQQRWLVALVDNRPPQRFTVVTTSKYIPHPELIKVN